MQGSMKKSRFATYIGLY